MRSIRRFGVLLVWSLAAMAPAWSAGGGHEHGVARLEIVVEPAAVRIRFDSALDNLVGFEREPRSGAEKKAVVQALVQLRDSAELFRIDAGAQCGGAKAVLAAAPWGIGTKVAPAAHGEGHADLVADYEFRCAAGGQARHLELGLFEAFPRLKRIEIQVVTPRGQLGAVLKPGRTRVALVR